MGNSNYVSVIVKVLENPRKTFSKGKIPMTTFRSEIPQVRKNKIIHLIFFGKLADNVKEYYQVNDYILVEGYLSIKENLLDNLSRKNLKKIEVSVLKIYPLYFEANRH